MKKIDNEHDIIDLRISFWKKIFSYDLRFLVWDIFFTILVGTLYTMIIVEPANNKQAFLSSLTGESFIFYFINSARNNLKML